MGIRQEGDSILREVATPFDLPSDTETAVLVQKELLDYIARLKDFYPFRRGVGLAAPQIGIPRAMAVVSPVVGDDILLTNPIVLWQSETEHKHSEGCLSFFDVRGVVSRPEAIQVRVTSFDGSTKEIRFDQEVAWLVQHEIDHLEGVLYTDHPLSSKLTPAPNEDHAERISS